MKNRFLLVFVCSCAAFLSCSKEANQPCASRQTGKVSAVIDAGIPASKLGLDGINFYWQPGDQVRARIAGGDWLGGNYDLFTLDSDWLFKGTLTYIAKANLWLFASNEGFFPDNSSASLYRFPFASEQSGLLSDLSKYSVRWAKSTSSQITPLAGGDYKIKAAFKPFFSIVKFNVPESLEVTKIEIAGHSLGGELSLAPSRSQDAWGNGKFANFRAETEFDTISVYRAGQKIAGEVFVVVSPNSYDPGYGDYVNDTEELSVSIYSASGLIKTFKGELDMPILNGVLKNLGSIQE